MAATACSYEEFLEILKGKGTDHIAFYHYTRWGALSKMLTPVDCADGQRHRV